MLYSEYGHMVRAIPHNRDTACKHTLSDARFSVKVCALQQVAKKMVLIAGRCGLLAVTFSNWELMTLSWSRLINKEGRLSRLQRHRLWHMSQAEMGLSRSPFWTPSWHYFDRHKPANTVKQ